MMWVASGIGEEPFVYDSFTSCVYQTNKKGTKDTENHEEKS